MSCWTFPQLADAVVTMNASARQLLNDTAWGMPGQPGGENLTPAQGAAAWANYLSLGIRGFSVGFETLTPAFIQQAHARLLPVYAWTVDYARCVARYMCCLRCLRLLSQLHQCYRCCCCSGAAAVL